MWGGSSGCVGAARCEQGDGRLADPLYHHRWVIAREGGSAGLCVDTDLVILPVCMCVVCVCVLGGGGATALW
jgi:hypothetical protein